MCKQQILFIMHLPPPVHGAAMVGKYIQESKLINDAFECHYINLTTATSLEDIGKGGIKKLVRFAKLLGSICKKVKQLRPGLVYVTPNACGGAFYKDFVVVQMLKLMGCKIVVHYHNKGISTRQERWLDDKLYKIFFRDIKVILLAEALYEDVKKYVNRDDVYICPNGIPKTLTEKPKARRKNEVLRLLFLSNLLISKGVLVLLDACKILADKGYSFVCDFVGGETAEIDAERFKVEIEKRNLNKIVIYQGKKYDEEKKKALEAADIFTFPTYNDCFPLVSLEAMEHKLPIVATNEGGITDIVKNGENGFICEKQNAESLSTCIEYLLVNSELREKMGEDGFRKFKKHFTLQVFENTFIDCVNKCKSGGVKSYNIIWYYGKKHGSEKEIFWQDADVFVFPTFYRNECFPLVLLEAMQHGVACISTREGGIPAIIDEGKTGCFVEKENPEMLAERIELFILNPSICESMGSTGKEKYLQEFTIQRFEERFKEILGKCSC